MAARTGCSTPSPSAQAHVKAVAAEEFQVWTLKVNTDHSALLTCEDGNGNAVHQQKLKFTDFPLPEVKFFYCNNVIHLPSEKYCTASSAAVTAGAGQRGGRCVVAACASRGDAWPVFANGSPCC
ncbi:MAG: hypothetical protein QM756_05055 [Polyangiaceae bacterium]